MKQKDTPTLKQRLHSLAAFLPIFKQQDFAFGTWSESKDVEPRVFTMPDFRLSKHANAFFHSAYDLGWVLRDFNWPQWAQTTEAAGLRDDPAKMAHATPDQLFQLITIVIRQDRFCDGALESAFESGLLTAICRRAAHLESETDDGEA